MVIGTGYRGTWTLAESHSSRLPAAINAAVRAIGEVFVVGQRVLASVGYVDCAADILLIPQKESLSEPRPEAYGKFDPGAQSALDTGVAQALPRPAP
jgi:hypothetical protein